MHCVHACEVAVDWQVVPCPVILYVVVVAGQLVMELGLNSLNLHFVAALE